MTKQELDAMTPHEKRIHIAESCGWKYFQKLSELRYGKSKDFCDLEQVPDYLNDLNACHEFEKILTPAQRISYAKELDWIHSDMLSEPVPYSGELVNWPQAFDILNSTSQQRADAFLLTL